MITSAKNYIKKKKSADRTLGQMVKAKLYRHSHTKKHTHTHSQKVKKYMLRKKQESNQINKQIYQ